MDKLVDLSSTFLVDPGSKLNVSSVSVSVYHRTGVTRLALHPVQARFFSRAQSSLEGYAGVPSNGDLLIVQ